jgi:hypothetical protein
MATKLGDMTSAGTLAGTELVYVQVGTATGDERKSTVDAFKTYALDDFSANGLSLVSAANYAAMRGLLDLEAGTDFNAYSANLAALSAMASTGLMARTGSGTYTTRTLTAPAAGITVADGDGVAGNPTLALADDLAALEALSGTDTIYYRSGASTWSAVTVGTGLSFSAGTLANTGVAGGAITGSGLTMATARILGRTTASTGAIEELTAGTGLVLSAGSLAVDTGTSGAKVPLLNGANTHSGLATFSAGADITPASTPSATAVGYLGAPQMSDQDDYTLVMADAGKHYYHVSGSTHTLTIPANASVAFPIGTVIAIVNESGGGNLSIAITSDTLRWGSSTGTRTLAANGTATLLKVTSTVWRLTGDGIT